MIDLTFSALRRANLTRLPLFRNSRGEPAHATPDGSDWCLAQWCNAVTGEVGEAANLIKKIERGDLTLDEARPALARELADIMTYLDLLAFRAGVDLAEATATKWDEVSERVGLPLRMAQFADPVALSDEEFFVLDWLGRDDSSALGECNGAGLSGLIDKGLAEIGPQPKYHTDPRYRRVWVTEAGRSRLAAGRAS